MTTLREVVVILVRGRGVKGRGYFTSLHQRITLFCMVGFKNYFRHFAKIFGINNHHYKMTCRMQEPYR